MANTHTSQPKLPLSIGYPINPPEDFVERLIPFLDRVKEVYFSIPGQASGRAASFNNSQKEQFIKDMINLREQGVKLNLLFNANCYGADALSLDLTKMIKETLASLENGPGLPDSASTTSPAIAHILKSEYPDIKVRASVNMRIGTVAAMKAVKDLFDEFCVQRDINRNLSALEAVKTWADGEGKKLTVLANSGCLRNCPGQIFHDNFVAHGAADTQNKIPGFIPFICHRFLKDEKNHQAILQETWIRPEDIHRYNNLVNGIKLATRIHPRPFQVIRAYAEQKHTGNLLDLFEPGNGQFLKGNILDNTKFSDDWFKHSTTCRADGECEYCESLLNNLKG